MKESTRKTGRRKVKKTAYIVVYGNGNAVSIAVYCRKELLLQDVIVPPGCALKK